MKIKPKFLLSKKAALDQYNQIKQFGDIVSYSFKTNNDVGQILKENTETMFSIHGHLSIDKLNCPERIWFFSQAWDQEEISELFEKGLRNFVVDNMNDLNQLIEFIEAKKNDTNSNDYKINILLRMRLKEHTIHTGKHFVFGLFSHQVIKLIPKLKENPLIDKLGIHFHRKTQNVSEWSLKYELESVFSDDILKQLDFINIGGGIPSKYKNFRAKVHENIFAKITEMREWLNQYDIKVIIEPGRFIAAPSIKLKTKIVNIYDHNIVINASIYSGAMDTFVSHIRLLIDGELPDREGEAFTIKGKTPDSMDIFRYKVNLSNPKIGDTLIFLNAGAYTYDTSFCGLEKIETEIIE